MSQILLSGPTRKLPQQRISSKLLMADGNRSVYAWKLYIMRNNLYFICILIDFSKAFRHKEPGFP